MHPVFALVDRTVAAACRGVLYLTLGTVFLILTANVGLRYLLGTSLAWASELPELLFPWMIMAGVVLAAQQGSHIAVVILTQRMRPAVRRWVLSAGALAVAALYIGLALAALPLMEIAADERTPILQVPGSVGVGCLVAGFVLLSLVTLLRLPAAWHGRAADPYGTAEAEAAVGSAPPPSPAGAVRTAEVAP